MEIEMTDKELLELAAKAFFGDVFVERYDEKQNYLVVSAETSGIRFAPLTDNDDAFRLAVKLELTIKCRSDYVEIFDEFGNSLIVLRHDKDPYAATRRAIVNAAAEIGRGMK
jgi:hypothetical protein